MMSPKFNHYAPKTRARENKDAAYDENGTPLYSTKKTKGTEEAAKLLQKLARRPDGKMLVPPSRAAR